MDNFDRLLSQLGKHVVPPERGVRGGRRAAVLLALTNEEMPRIILTRRAHTLRHHPGQFSFPGGGIDPGETEVDAALREAHEEVGVHPALVRVIGQLPTASIPVSAADVTPVVAIIDPDTEVDVVDQTEVASVALVRLSDLADPKNRIMARIPGRPYRGPAFDIPEGFVWGFTAYLLDLLLESGGWAVPWDRQKVVDVPQEYRRDKGAQ